MSSSVVSRRSRIASEGKNWGLTIIQSHPLQMRRHINTLVNGMNPKPRPRPCRREAVDVLGQVPVLNSISVPLHYVTNGMTFLPSRDLVSSKT